jgi:hypothetical protein
MASTERKYSLNVLIFSREAWLHGKPKDSGGNIPFLEVPFSNFHSQNDLFFENFTTYAHTFGNGMIEYIKERWVRGKNFFLFSSFFIKSCILERARKGGKRNLSKAALVLYKFKGQGCHFQFIKKGIFVL